MVFGNSWLQVFCIPTLWAGILLGICFLSLCIYPLLSADSRWLIPASFVNGITWCVLLYCLIFLEWMNVATWLLIIWLGLGLIGAMPQFLWVQLLWTHLWKPVSRKVRYSFLAGIIPCVIVFILAGKEYATTARIFEDGNWSELKEHEWMAEKIAGMHFIYHIRFCEYDGWRPPKHEPILVIGLWLNNRKDPLNVSLEERVRLYKELFPDRPVKFTCSCAWDYRESYHRDKLWK